MAPHVNSIHCIIHRESLASKTLEPELKHILDIAIKMVNYIKTRPLNIRLALKGKCADPGCGALISDRKLNIYYYLLYI